MDYLDLNKLLDKLLNIVILCLQGQLLLELDNLGVQLLRRLVRLQLLLKIMTVS